MAPNTHTTKKWELFAGRNRFYCDGLLMSAPHTGVFYLTCFLITGTSMLFFAFDCPYLATRITPAIPIVGALLYFFTMSSLLRTTFTDPGIIPRASHDEAAYIEKQIEVPNSLNSPTYRPPPRTKEVLVKGQVVKLKYCFTCKIFRPPRASHCSLCDNCVDRFDHHCPWVGNCVGKRNYRFFYMFLVSLAFLAVFIFSCSITHLVLLMKNKQEVIEVIREAPFSVIVTIICFFSIWSVIGLAGFHTYLTTSDQTTNEDLKGSFSSKGGQRSINPYSRGNICLNCFHILCGPMTPSLIDRRGIVTDEFILQMQNHSPNNQLTEITTTQQSGMIMHQPMIGGNNLGGAGDMKPRLYDESNPTLGMYRHRSYDNLQNGNSNSLAHLVDNEIPLSTLDATATITPTTVTLSPISPGNQQQAIIIDEDNNIETTKKISNNLSGSYNNLFRDNLDNSFAEIDINDGAIMGNIGGGINEQIDLTTLPQSSTIHEFQQQLNQNISDNNTITTMSRRLHLQKSASESENVYSNVPNTTNQILTNLNSTNLTTASTTIPINTALSLNSDGDSNKSDPSLHVYSNLIEERQNQEFQQQHPTQIKQPIQHLQQPQQPQQQPQFLEKKQSHIKIELVKPLDISISSIKNNISKRGGGGGSTNKNDDIIKETSLLQNDDSTNIMSSTLLSDDLDLDDPVSAFVVNNRNRKYQSIKTNVQNRKNSESDIQDNQINNSRTPGIGILAHQNPTSSNNSNNNLVKDSNRLKLLHDTTMIDTALDLDSLDGSSISQNCLVKTAII